MTRARNPNPDRNRGRGNGGGNGGGQNGVADHQEAKRMLHLMMQPYLNQITRSIREGRQTTNQTVNRVGNAYTEGQNALAALNAPEQAQFAGIQSNLTNNLNTLAPSVNANPVGVAPTNETTAASNALGATGAGALSLLSGNAATQTGYNTSAQRQGIEEATIAKRNALQDFGNFKQGMLQQKVDLMRQAPAQLKQILSDLQQRDLNNHLALAQLAMDRMTNNAAVGASNASTAQANAVLQYIRDWVAAHPNQPLPAGAFGI